MMFLVAFADFLVNHNFPVLGSINSCFVSLLNVDTAAVNMYVFAVLCVNVNTLCKTYIHLVTVCGIYVYSVFKGHLIRMHIISIKVRFTNANLILRIFFYLRLTFSLQ